MVARSSGFAQVTTSRDTASQWAGAVVRHREEPGSAARIPDPHTVAQRPAPVFLAASIFLASFASLRSFALFSPASLFLRSRWASSGVSRMYAGAIFGSPLSRSTPLLATGAGREPGNSL
ncbi:hypothetical protein ASR50_21750 [Streptomyces sp. 4F]|nr:hypothetical protein ASR50_21750 [Streptomyces sp. 4F]